MMKRLLLPVLLLAAAAAAGQEGAFRPGVALRDSVNIRSRPSLEAEVLGQLQRGEAIRAVGEVSVAAPGDPALWYIIELPAAVRVWVEADQLDPAGRAVRTERAAVRSGPARRFEIIGELVLGDMVARLAREGDWVAIRPPADVVGFVAADFVNVEAPRPAAAPAPAAPPADEAAPAAIPPPPPVPVPEPAPLSTGPSEIRRQLDEAGQPRIVRREGRLARAWNIQAPGHFLLRDVRTGRVMNYLHGERFEDRRWRDMVGRVVIVEGREFLDARWPKLPVLEAERVELIR